MLDLNNDGKEDIHDYALHHELMESLKEDKQEFENNDYVPYECNCGFLVFIVICLILLEIINWIL